MFSSLECFDYTLMPHIILVLMGLVMLTPLSEKIASNLSERDRILTGLLLAGFGGFTVSAHTLWMHNKAQEMGGGSFCSSGSVCDCGSVIGNAEWNTVPFLGLPWGLLGMLAFALFMWLVISIAKEPGANWVIQNIKVGTNFGILGMLIVFYLMYAEFSIGKICQFCTTAHVAHVIVTVGFFRLAKAYESDNWDSASSKTSEEVVAKERRRRGGYVAPKQASEEE